MVQIRPLLSEKYSPVQSNGKGLQGIYLKEVSVAFGELLFFLSNAKLPAIEQELAPVFDAESDYEINLEIVDGVWKATSQEYR